MQANFIRKSCKAYALSLRQVPLGAGVNWHAYSLKRTDNHSSPRSEYFHGQCIRPVVTHKLTRNDVGAFLDVSHTAIDRRRTRLTRCMHASKGRRVEVGIICWSHLACVVFRLLNWVALIMNSTAVWTLGFWIGLPSWLHQSWELEVLSGFEFHSWRLQTYPNGMTS